MLQTAKLTGQVQVMATERKSNCLQHEAGAAAYSSISVSVLLFYLESFYLREQKNLSELDGMPYAKVQKDKPVLRLFPRMKAK